MIRKFDFLIIGSGVAGMSYALKVARAKKGKIAIICKTTIDEANTAKAQGGIASVTNLLVDNFEKHIEDTMIAGDYISDRDAVEQVVRNAPEQIRELVNWGAREDLSKRSEAIPTSKCSKTTSLWKSSPSTTSGYVSPDAHPTSSATEHTCSILRQGKLTLTSPR